MCYAFTTESRELCVRRLEKLVGRPPVMVVVDEEVVAVVAVEMAVVVAAISEVVGVVLVTQQRM